MRGPYLRRGFGPGWHRLLPAPVALVRNLFGSSRCQLMGRDGTLVQSGGTGGSCVNPWTGATVASGGIVSTVAEIAGVPLTFVHTQGARANYTRQSAFSGATAGVVGSGGTLPTGWTFNNDWTSGTRTIALGSDADGSYLEIRFQGTSSLAQGDLLLGDAGTNGQPAVQNDVVTIRGVAKLVANSGATTVRSNIVRHTAAGAYIAGFASPSVLPTIGVRTDYTRTVTITDATCAYVGTRFFMNHAGTYDYTLRIYANSLQLEKGAFSGLYLPVTAAGVTRTADSILYTPSRALSTVSGEILALACPYLWSANAASAAPDAVNKPLWNLPGTGNNFLTREAAQFTLNLADAGGNQAAGDTSNAAASGTVLSRSVAYDTSLRLYRGTTLANQDVSVTAPWNAHTGGVNVGEYGSQKFFGAVAIAIIDGGMTAEERAAVESLRPRSLAIAA
jgi:hypothetical protein